MNEFHIQKRTKSWRYEYINLDGFDAHSREVGLKNALQNAGVDSRILATCRVTENAINWYSEFSDLKELEKNENKQQILNAFAHDRDKVLDRLDPSESMYSWFKEIFNSITIFSNGKNYCLVWGVHLKENEKIDFSQFSLLTKEDKLNEPSQVEVDLPPPIIDAPPNEEDPFSEEPQPVEPNKSKYDYRFWMLLLLGLLLLFLIIYFLFNCRCEKKVFSHVIGDYVENPRPEFLPDIPNSMPFLDNEDISFDSLYGGVVANDLINIAMMSRNQDFEDFLDMLDEELSNEDVEFTYWDPQTRRVQIECERSQVYLDSISHSIKENFPEFELLIWPERLFISSSTDDPAWQHDNAIWHLKEVGFDEIIGKYSSSSDVRLAIIDDGFDLTHEDMTNNLDFAYNLINRSNHVTASRKRTHGTHVSGFAVAQSNNKIGTVGISSNCTFVPIQIGSDNQDYLSSTSIIDGVLYAYNQDVDVINLSLATSFTSHDAITLRNYVESTQDEGEFWKSLFNKLEEKTLQSYWLQVTKMWIWKLMPFIDRNFLYM